MARKDKYPTPPVDTVHPAGRTEELAQIANEAIRNFSGSADELERALGMLMLGDYFGWKPLVVVHNKRTVRKYEGILGISVREFFPEEGPLALRSLGYSIAKDLGNFWKVVSGDISVEGRRELTDSSGTHQG
jgi:hypothetical protein